MKTKILYTMALGLALLFSSCLDDLNTKPLDENALTDDQIYSIEANYFKSLVKIYTVYTMSGQNGAGNSDLEGMDPGNTQLYRSWWNTQVITTDEALNAWGDPWVMELNELRWTTSQNESVEGVYQRCMFIVAIANEYLTQTTDEKMESRGINQNFWSTVHTYRAEARFLRALAYSILMDSFGRPPFITEHNFSEYPTQISREELFDWIEKELLESRSDLGEPRFNYGRVDKGAANALLSRLYLNAEVYTGKNRYTDCITASKAVIDAGYDLTPVYANLFKADNNITSAQEIIFPLVFDGASSESFGGIRYLIAASRGAGEASSGGIEDAWGGNRSTSALVKKFEFSNPDYGETGDKESILDKRGIFHTQGRTLEIDKWDNTFDSQGWGVYKYSNFKSDGTLGSNVYDPDTDIPFLRLGEIYLNYAEAVVRGGQGGDKATALDYINALRARGYGDNSGDITAQEMTKEFILDERARELYWEGTRRTDLVRYDYFTSNAYLWPFKGGNKTGTAIESYKNVFPISLSDMSANTSLTQNDGYSK